jgi:hypothetical protein
MTMHDDALPALPATKKVLQVTAAGDCIPGYTAEQMRAYALAGLAARGESWRDLAMQFDQHRMAALWHLRAMIADPAAHAEQASAFLAAPPAPSQAEASVQIALAARAGDQRPTAWALAASLDILADRGEVNCTLWSDATRPEQEWTEPLYADDPRLTWGVPHAGTIRCLRAAEDRIRSGEPPAEVFADYGWTMDAAPPAPSHEAMRAALEALDACEFAGKDAISGGPGRIDKARALLRAALGGESQS